MEDYCSETRAYFTLFGEDFPVEEFTREIGSFQQKLTEKVRNVFEVKQNI